MQVDFQFYFLTELFFRIAFIFRFYLILCHFIHVQSHRVIVSVMSYCILFYIHFNLIYFYVWESFISSDIPADISKHVSVEIGSHSCFYHRSPYSVYLIRDVLFWIFQCGEKGCHAFRSLSIAFDDSIGNWVTWSKVENSLSLLTKNLIFVKNVVPVIDFSIPDWFLSEGLGSCWSGWRSVLNE